MELELTGHTRVGAILNTASGSCDLTSEEKMMEILGEAGIRLPKVWCGNAEAVTEAFAQVIHHELDVLIVLGGDGTIRAAAAAAGIENGPLLIPLPGGTMNMLPKALYGVRTWEEALRETLARPRIRTVSGGDVNGERFFIAAIMGAPALWAEAREAMRERDLGAAVEKGVSALQNMFAAKVRYVFSDTSEGEAEAISVICPLISDELDDSEQYLEAAVIDVNGATEAIALASTAAFGKWRDDRHVTVQKTREIQVMSEQDIPAILDGETFEIGIAATVRFIPRAFRVLVPAA